MSCFESSTFLKNPLVMSQGVLSKACEKLGWKYEIRNQTLSVLETHHNVNLRGEPALVVSSDNTVRYNSYYMKNGRELMKELEAQFYEINVEYSRQTVIETFTSLGFSLKMDYDFVANETEIHKFSMIGRTKIKTETERKTEIGFTILNDGTVVSDSDYIPEDLHELADKAMEKIDKSFGTERREGFEIKRKEIPAKYRHKSYCTLNNKIKAKH